MASVICDISALLALGGWESERPPGKAGVPIGQDAELALRGEEPGQTAPRPVRERPVTAFTTTTVMIAPMVATTIELRSNGPSIGCELNSTPARKPPTRAPTMPRTMWPITPRP